MRCKVWAMLRFLEGYSRTPLQEAARLVTCTGAAPVWGRPRASALVARILNGNLTSDQGLLTRWHTSLQPVGQ